MTQSRHTPGPWAVEEPLADEMDQQPLITAHGGKTLVAEILQPLTDEEGLYRGHYDALLIAAAPDLMAALAEFVAIDARNYNPSPGTWDAAVVMARAALRKARGEVSGE